MVDRFAATVRRGGWSVVVTGGILLVLATPRGATTTNREVSTVERVGLGSSFRVVVGFILTVGCCESPLSVWVPEEEGVGWVIVNC